MKNFEENSMEKDGDYFIKNDVVMYKYYLHIVYKDSNTGAFNYLVLYFII